MGCFFIDFTTILNFYSSRCQWSGTCNQKTTHDVNKQQCMVGYSAGTSNPHHNFLFNHKLCNLEALEEQVTTTSSLAAVFHCHLVHSHVLQHLTISAYG